MSRVIDPNKWDIEGLKEFFESAKLPKTIKTPFGNIKNVDRFVKTHLKQIQANEQKKAFKPYYDRMVELMEIIKTWKSQKNNS